MSIKNYNMRVIITDAMTGRIITSLPYDTIKIDTMARLISDIISEDSLDKHGFLFKYGIEP